MAMAILYHFPIFHSLSSHKLIFCSSHFPLSNPNINYPHTCRYSTIVASSIKKSTRTSRKMRSDADLYNDIRDFLSTTGLPENHVPTMKELSQYGRQDLANVVRRRGYKFIRQLLTTTSTENIVRQNIDTCQTGNMEVLGDCEGEGGGEGEGEGEGQDENDKVFVDVSSNESSIETDEELKWNDQSYVAMESNTLLSLQEKVAKFIQHGELDTIKGSALEITNEEGVDEYGRNIESEDSQKSESVFSNHEQNEVMISGGELSNGSVPLSVHNTEDPGYISVKEQTSTDDGEDLNDEKVENQAEIRHLKFLLHKKELELTQLKEQIEKEKNALSHLQTKAETEINKAHKLISQKETELHAAEETLFGLKEVEVDYSGDGETVELAGSFNGWDHKITMDPQPSSRTSSRLWRAVLWLYPGVYEIKFIIDGRWRVDPVRESINLNGVHNNILRVDR